MRETPRNASAFRTAHSLMVRVQNRTSFFVSGKNKTMDLRPRNEQLMHADAPPTIRQLAEQHFALREEDHRENSVRKQRDDTLYRRSMDPRLTHTRENAPDATSMPKFTKEGVIQRRPANAEPGKKPAPAEPQKPAEPDKDSTMLHRTSGSSSSSGGLSRALVGVLIIAAVAGVIMLCTCDWQKK